jgi:hypothetical protein
MQVRSIPDGRCANPACPTRGDGDTARIHVYQGPWDAQVYWGKSFCSWRCLREWLDEEEAFGGLDASSAD